MLRVPPEKPGQGLRLQGRPWGGCQAQHKVLAAWTAGQARRLQAGLLWSLPALSDPGDPGQGRGSGIVQASAPHPPHTACSTEGLSAVLPAPAWAEGAQGAPLPPPSEPRSPPAKGLAAKSRQGSALGPSGRPFSRTGVARA